MKLVPVQFDRFDVVDALSEMLLLWAARYNTWLLNTLTPKGVVFFFSFFSEMLFVRCKRFAF